jgi:hypothetical protein
MSYLFNSDHRVHRQRPRATPSAWQRRCVHRSFGRYTAVMEERGRRVGLENGMASRSRYMESDTTSNLCVVQGTAPEVEGSLDAVSASKYRTGSFSGRS